MSGVTVSPTALTVTEEETTGASYRVVLDSQPTADVVITVAGHVGTEVTPSPTSLTFTTSDWDTGQTVTVTADADADTVNDTVTLTHGAMSTDSDYDGNSITIASVTVTVTDNDTANTAPTFNEDGSTTRTFDETIGDATVTTAGDIGTPVSAMDPDTGDTLTYSLEGTDMARFGIIATSGQIRTKVGENYDYEAKTSYSVTVKVDDGNGGTATITVTIEVANIVELQPLTGDARVEYAENRAVRVAAYSASSEEDRELLTWSLSGADSGSFRIDEPGGVLRFDLAAAPPNLFSPQPDYEAPADTGKDGNYEVTVEVGDGATSHSLAVEVTITDQDDAGTLTLSTTRPELVQALMATLADPDGVTGTATYRWERSAGRSAWTDIVGATASSYTPTAAEAGHYLRVTAIYTDGHGSGKTAQTVAPNVVLARTLSRLEVVTTSSRQMYPEFDPDILHYAVGCIAADTLSLTLSTTDAATLLAVDGVQYANQNAVVELTGRGGESDILITLSGRDGASTTYTLHCLAETFPTLTVTKLDGASESLMTVLYPGTVGGAYLGVIDHNGVPRFRRQGDTAGHFRAFPDGGYPYGATRRGPDSSTLHTVYDANLDVVQSGIRTVNLQDTDSHDFFIKSNGDYVLIAYEPAVRDLSFITEQYGLTHSNGDPFGPAEDTEDSVIQVITPAGQEVFLWNSWDHMALEDCTQHRFPDDYAHINSLQVVDGDIIASFRGCSKVLRIDGTSGEVIWRLGRSNLSTEEWESRDIGPPPLKIVGDPYGEFCGQHASRLLENGNLILFDNGVQCLEDPRTGTTVRVSNQFSRVVEYAIDLEHGEAIFQRHVFLHGRMDSLSYAMGQADPLDNGNWLTTWGRGLRVPNPGDPPPPDGSATQVNPATGVEELTVVASLGGEVQTARRMYPVAPVALAAEPIALTAEFPVSTYTSNFHSGATDSPQAVVSFSRPVEDFDKTTPSFSVTGATVASVSAHVVAGEPANAHLVTLTPDGAGAITFGLVAHQACASGGICAADGTTLSEVPQALVIDQTATTNTAPVITTTSPLSVAENTREVATLAATDADTADSLTWSKNGGSEADRFELTTGGALTFVSAPDHETPTDAGADNGYEVNVRVSDGTANTDLDLTINVTDQDEPPPVMNKPVVTATANSTTSLEVSWTEPSNPGRPDIDSYDLQYRAGSTGDFSNGPQDETGRSAAIGNLTADTSYEVRVRATNAEGDGVWSPSGTGRTNAEDNAAPTFDEGGSTTRTLAETVGDATVGTASDIGTPVSATDPDTGDTLEYRLEGTDRAKFTFDTSSGQIRTKVGENYDYEARTSYSVRVAVNDGTVTVSSTVTINVTDQDEPPPVMNKPVVTATANSTTSLEVSWTEPSNPGRPDIDSYDLQYRAGSTGDFSNGPQDETGRSAAIGNLTADTSYEVRVRATNAEGDGVWSPSGTGRTNAEDNAAPIFNDGGSTTRTLAETVGDATVTSAADIGTPVSATDPDTGDTLEYRLEGTDRTKFGINATSGQIRTKVGENYDYEARTSYSVRVAVNDGTVTVSSTVTINVTDQDEPPPVMNKPVVTATANSTTSLEVSWTAPSNTGRPRIDSYDLQYRVGNTGGFSNGPQNQTGSSAAIGNLTADTSYEVRVRATNAEGDGVWSPSGTGNTGRTTITTDPPGVTVSETALTVTEEDPTGESYTVVLDSQPTADVVVTVAGHAGTEVTPSPASLTFTRSNWDMDQTVTVTAGSDADTVNDTVTLTHSAASADSNYDGNSITIASVTVTVNDNDEDTPAAGICGRTEEVRDALVELILGVSDCAAVTDANLAAITGPLNLSGQNISALAAGDFAGLTGLTELYLNNNGLTTLPKDVFAGLTALKVLTLYYNELTTLPDGVFGQLTSLNFLYLGDNPRAPFAPTAVARPDAGTVPVAGGTVTLDGSGSGGPWGTNVTYRWALTTPASGVRVTFDDATSATPEATIPTLAAGTELTFTLTVTGRGGSDGIETATDTARVTATQNITNNPPVFAGGTVQARTFDETIGDTAVTSASDIGTPVSATDPDTGDRLTYVLLGADRDKFTFDTSSGQIRTKVGENYDYEARTRYSVRVAVTDGTVTVSSAVTINVTDEDESPPVMNKPVVTATANSTTSLEVSWTAPSNPGRPRIGSYDLQYRVGSNGDFSNGPQDETGSRAAIGNLTANTEYEVRVRATNAEGDGVWSPSGTGQTNAEDNAAPTFNDGGSTRRTFDETIGDTAVTSASDIGTPVSATDPDTGDTLEYRLEGTDMASFGIIGTNGQLRTKSGQKYDYEAETSYSVTVRVVDSQGASDTIAVTINVTDQNEPPPVMNKPVVTATANSTTSLEVSWTEPSNPGRPRIGSYDLQYRVGSTGDFSNGPQDETGSSAAIGNLTADTSYEVRVRATNAEGDGVWSPSGTGQTNAEDTDPPGVTVSPTALTVTEEDMTGASYRVVLDSQPTAEVVVTVVVPSGTEVTPSPTSLTFTRSNWDTAQTVTVTAGSDADTVTDTVTLTHGAASADSDYDGNSITIASVTVTVTDDDTATAAATLSGLELEGATGSEPIDLSPAFDADTITYTAVVANRINGVKLTATKNDSNATVVITNDDDLNTPGEADLALNVGSNTLTLTLTAEDGTPQTYKITVTRAAAPPVPTDCPADTDWCTTMGVGNSSATTNPVKLYISGYRSDRSFGDLGSTMFSHGGTSYSVSGIYRIKVLDGTTVFSEDFNLLVSSDLPDGTVLQVGSRTFTVGTDSVTGAAGHEAWDIQADPLNWTEGQHVTVSLKFPITDPPGVTVSETALTVTEEDPTGESYTVVLDSQPTADVVVTVAGHAGTEVTPSPASLTFTRSNWDMDQTVTVTAGSDADTVNDTVTLTHSAASADSDYDGNSITIASVAVTVNDDDEDTPAAGICGRTEEVRDALVELILGVSDCAAVTAADLAAITDTLNLAGQNITELAAGDFAGLTGLIELYLNNNGLTTLPEDVFAGLTSLKVLTLYYNELTTLPDGVFGQLTSLNFLYLGDNPRAPFAPTAVARPDAGTVPVAGGTVTLDGSGSGGPWGTNVTYRWALTTPASRVRVTFDDSTSATPEATIPTLAAGTELTFTLTVTGRGGSDGIETATDTARVTATQNITNNPPVFAGGTVQARTFDETIGDATVGAAADIGTPVSATDPDTGDRLTYVLLGADRDKFTFDTSSGQIKTRAGESYDYEARTSYSVTVAVIDGTVTVSSAVTLIVTDQDEPPPVMNQPVVTATANSTTSLEVSWTAPSNPGRPRIGSYDLQYRVGSNGGFSNGPQDETGSSAAIGNLTADTEYQVRVRATNAEGDGVWSPSGTGTTGRTTITTDPPGVTVSPTALTVTEEDMTGASYRVVLDSQPTAEVVVTVVVPSGTEVTPSPTSLTFTRSNWDTAQTVTVTAGSDADTVNDTVTLTHSAASADSDYDGNSITIASVTVTVTDDDIDNAAPTFDEGGSTTRTFNETVGDETVGTASDIGTPVSATDPDTGDTLEYSLEGTDRTKFGINATSGQIRTKVGENYDYEARTSYSVRVAVNDGTVTVSSTVTINVTDQDEPPPVMNQPVVTATANSTTSLEVSWTEPSNPGRPDIESYDLQYRAGSTGDFSNGPQDQTGSSAAIGNLTADTSYEVRVRATNAEGDGVWSPSGTGTTGRTTITTDPPGVTVSPTALTVTEEDTAGDSYRVVLDSQPTAEVVVTVAGHAGTEVTPSPTSLTFTRSNWDTAQTVTVTAGDDADTVNDTVTLTHSAASTDSNYQGITIDDVTVTDNDIDTTAGICGRTEEVRDALLAQIPGVSDCAAVTAADLAAITGPLDLSGQNITALAAGDFAGLTGLIELYLNNNKLTTLRGDVFAGLPVLTQLQLNNNELETLPKDVFAGLPVLKLLTLYDNDLGKLPDGVFETLTALAYLGLYGNPGAPFAPTAVALPDAGTVPVAGGTVTLDGRGSDGGPWGMNVTYRWALTTPASGVRVTFDDSTSATPEATIPTLAAGTELAFTLTVTGPGGTQGTAPGTDTATVTATDSVTASGDATLGPLRVNDGTGELTLAPAFASGTFASMRRRWATRSRRSR